LKRAFAPLRAHAMRDLRAESAAGKILIESHLDLRYQGQSYEIQLPMRSRFRQHFHDAHRRLYGYADPERPVEVVNLRVLARIRGPALPRARPSHVAGAASSHRLRQGGRWTRARRIERAALPANRALRGPLVITELSATTVVPTGWTARQTVDGDLLLTRPR
jgi:N-methylhydantoinase A